jgi:hypothetical protein
MKSNLLIILTLFGQILSAQTFTEVLDTPFEVAAYGAIAFSDVDGDNDPDVLITGENNLGDVFAKLYTNEGGIFTEVLDTPFIGSGAGAVAFVDVDGDNDPDVIITGDDDEGNPFGKLYTNDGGKFTEVLDTPFSGGEGGTIDVSDIDGDNDPDVLITGEGTGTTLYTNDGGKFTRVLGTPFEGAAFGSIAFSDVDGDNDPDVFITGQNSSGDVFAKLYTNEGGIFTEDLDTPFDGVGYYSSIAFSDVDGDNDPDVLITGSNSDETFISKLYTNEGGNFTEVVGTPFDGVLAGSIVFEDVDGDNDPDVLISGVNMDTVYISKLYTNEDGNFTEVMDTPFEGVVLGSIAFADVDGDNDPDVLITGLNRSGAWISKLYTNEGLVSSVENETEDLNFDFMLFPNPSPADRINVRYSSNENSTLTVNIFDMNGCLLRQQQEQGMNGQQTFSIDIGLLAKGNYIIQLDDGKRKGLRKFLVQ